jgi:hypothetical protein
MMRMEYKATGTLGFVTIFVTFGGLFHATIHVSVQRQRGRIDRQLLR